MVKPVNKGDKHSNVNFSLVNLTFPEEFNLTFPEDYV
jgi:hypothetical protein